MLAFLAGRYGLSTLTTSNSTHVALALNPQISTPRSYYLGFHLPKVYLCNKNENVIFKTSNGDIIANGYGISYFVDQSVFPKMKRSEILMTIPF